MTQNNHDILLNILIEKYPNLAEIDKKELLHKLFKNCRRMSNKGFRLTRYGNDLFLTTFKSYTKDIEDFENMTTHDYVFLDGKNTPFYINKENKTITTYNDKLAMMIAMFNGNIIKLRLYEK